MLNAINYSEARKNLASIMDNICDERDIVVITRRKARPVVMMSLDDYNSIEETGYLLRSPANAQRLMESIDAMGTGRVLTDPLAVINESADKAD